MTPDSDMTVFVSAAEASGDEHAAKLVRALAARGVRCTGLGGPAMQSAGCALQQETVGRSAMLTHACGQVGFYWRLLKQVKRYFDEQRPRAVVVVDSPAWHFHVAKAARRRGIPVIYYIAPQLWAWGGWRLGKLRRCVDAVACILPFEEAWFQQRGVAARFVGHPLFDDDGQEPEAMSPWAGAAFPKLALLPGSRRHELERLWRPMQAVARQIKEQYPHAAVVAAASDEANAAWLHDHRDARLAVTISRAGVTAVCAEADLALVASGTATLQTAATGCPLMVLYHVPPWQWRLVGRWLLRTKHLSLVNILAGRALVPEFMPVLPKTATLAEAALALLADDGRRREMQAALRALTAPLAQPGASEKVAEMVMQAAGLPG